MCEIKYTFNNVFIFEQNIPDVFPNNYRLIKYEKSLNKTLLNVLDFQQFDNIYDRVELLLDDSGITDYIVKPLALENIGTLKNMKYINFC